LDGANGVNAALGFVKLKATPVPFQPAKIDDAPRFLLEIVDQGLVLYV
jgi:hypothetical protein